MDQISQLIKDYRWMKNEISRLQRIVYGSTFPMKSWGVAQYDSEAVIQKVAKGRVSQRWTQWINQMAVKHGMESNQFWQWVTQSMGEIGNKYGNSKLVVKQMAMLYEWLEEVYAEGRSGK